MVIDRDLHYILLIFDMEATIFHIDNLNFALLSSTSKLRKILTDFLV